MSEHYRRLDKILLVDKNQSRRHHYRAWFEADLEHKFGMPTEVIDGPDLRSLSKEIGTSRNEMIVIGDADRVPTRKIKRPSIRSGSAKFYTRPVEEVLRGFCVATLSARGPEYDGRLGGLSKDVTREALEAFTHRRPRVLVLDANLPEDTEERLCEVGLNPRAVSPANHTAFLNSGKYRAFDMILASADYDTSTLRIISNDGAAPVFLYSDTPPSDTYDSTEEGDLLRHKLTEALRHCENVKGSISPRDDWSLVARVANKTLGPVARSVATSKLRFNLSLGALPTTATNCMNGKTLIYTLGDKVVYSSNP